MKQAKFMIQLEQFLCQEKSLTSVLFGVTTQEPYILLGVMQLWQWYCAQIGNVRVQIGKTTKSNLAKGHPTYYYCCVEERFC